MKKTTVKLKLRASRSVPGHGRLVLHVTRHRTTRTMTTPHVLFSGEWDENRQGIVFSEDTSSCRRKELSKVERELKKEMKEVHETLKVLEAHGDYTSQEFVNFFRKRRQGQPFCEYVFKKAESLLQAGRFGTAHACRYAGVSFLKFLNGKDIRIDKIKAALMEGYEHYLLSEGKSKNTVSCYMRSLRAAYNSAVNEKVPVSKKSKDNPFSGVFTGNAKTEKRAISKECIAKLMEVELEGIKNVKETAVSSPAFSRDLFLFSFYTQGMSFSDMVNLKKEDIKDGVIRYRRKKTGQQITVKLEECMKAIIRRYQDKDSGYIFPVLKGNTGDYQRWKQTQTALAAFNRDLKKLAKLAGIEEHLTSYVARHSWASIASHVGIPIATISRGMGHESEKTTRIYISRADYSDVSRANRQILSHFVGKTPKTGLPSARRSVFATPNIRTAFP